MTCGPRDMRRIRAGARWVRFQAPQRRAAVGDCGRREARRSGRRRDIGDGATGDVADIAPPNLTFAIRDLQDDEISPFAPRRLAIAAAGGERRATVRPGSRRVKTRGPAFHVRSARSSKSSKRSSEAASRCFRSKRKSRHRRPPARWRSMFSARLPSAKVASSPSAPATASRVGFGIAGHARLASELDSGARRNRDPHLLTDDALDRGRHLPARLENGGA